MICGILAKCSTLKKKKGKVFKKLNVKGKTEYTVRLKHGFLGLFGSAVQAQIGLLCNTVLKSLGYFRFTHNSSWSCKTCFHHNVSN